MQDHVGHVEHFAEEVELAAQDLEREPLRFVVLRQEVDDRDVWLLPLAETAPDSLLDPLRISTEGRS